MAIFSMFIMKESTSMKMKLKKKRRALEIVFGC